MRTRWLLSAAAGLIAVGGLVLPAQATVIAAIQGCYDCVQYDTPALQFTVPNGISLTNAQMVLYAYQGLNLGTSQTVSLGTLSGTQSFAWGYISGAPSGTVPYNLTAYDYDDEWGNTPSGYTNSACVVSSSLCSVVGNFKVTFTATVSGGPNNGAPVYSVFSPTSNYTGGFVGWEGLDPNGLSETVYDLHSGSLSGTLAVIQIGTPPPSTPLPPTWTMMLVGLGVFGFLGYGRKKDAASAA